jgi:hypothetical protein
MKTAPMAWDTRAGMVRRGGLAGDVHEGQRRAMHHRSFGMMVLI